MRIYRWEGDNSEKSETIPYDVSVLASRSKVTSVMPNDELAFYQLVGEVMAHQG